MARGDLLDGIAVPLWAGGVFMVVLNGIILAHLAVCPVGDTISRTRT